LLRPRCLAISASEKVSVGWAARKFSTSITRLVGFDGSGMQDLKDGAENAIDRLPLIAAIFH
jgi:hypothetical protein